MPKENDAVTKSEPNSLLRPASLVILVLAILITLISNRKIAQVAPAAVINGQEFSLEIADTPATRAQGLSGRDSMSNRQGMLFVFDQPDAGCFWMKDMRFNLDIIWLDNSNKVIYMQQDLSPSTYPHDYCPGQNSQYVLEVNAGTAKSLNLKLSDKITLQNL